MQKVVCIVNMEGLTKGKLYPILGANSMCNSVTINDDTLKAVDVDLDHHVIWLATGNVARDTDAWRRMYMDYVTAIAAKGGDPKMFMQRLDSMTVGEMMDALAPNSITFATKANPHKEDHAFLKCNIVT